MASSDRFICCVELDKRIDVEIDGNLQIGNFVDVSWNQVEEIVGALKNLVNKLLVGLNFEVIEAQYYKKEDSFSTPGVGIQILGNKNNIPTEKIRNAIKNFLVIINSQQFHKNQANLIYAENDEYVEGVIDSADLFLANNGGKKVNCPIVITLENEKFECGKKFSDYYIDKKNEKKIIEVESVFDGYKFSTREIFLRGTNPESKIKTCYFNDRTQLQVVLSMLPEMVYRFELIESLDAKSKTIYDFSTATKIQNQDLFTVA